MDQRLRRDVVWNLVPIALLGVVGLGLNFLIAAWWGAAALGVFNLVSGVATLVSSVVAGFLWDRVGAAATFYAGAAFSAATIVLLVCLRTSFGAGQAH